LSGLQFFFTCEELRKTEDAPELTTTRGNWVPNPEPEFHTKNVDYGEEEPGVHNFWAYHFDGARLNPIPLSNFQPSILQGTVVKAKTVSIYHHSSTFWGVLYDITAPEHTDEEEEEDDDDDSSSDSNDQMDWNIVEFARRADSSGNTLGVSSVKVIGEHGTLYATRAGQVWPTLLFPDRYQPSFRRRNVHGRAPPYGSLNGNLCILIALLAFSALPFDTRVNDTFMTCIHPTGWRDPVGPRGDGCMLCYTYLLAIS
jgi:hypothetical protein